MLSKATIFLALFAASAKLASATPPACLLAAVNTFPDPSDMTALCGSDSSKMKSEIQSLCGSDSSAADAAYVQICKDAGVKVAAGPASKTPTTKSTSAKETSTSSKEAKTSDKASGNATKTATKSGQTTKATVTTHKAVGGGSTGSAPAPLPSGGSTSPASSPSSSPMPKPNAGNVVDAEGFAALALAAAGLVIFL